MNHRSLLALAIQIAFLAPSFAQETPSCDGTWKYTHLDKARGWPADVEVTVAGAKGTYVAHLGKHKAKNSPCRDQPLLVPTTHGLSPIEGYVGYIDLPPEARRTEDLVDISYYRLSSEFARDLSSEV